MQTFLFLPIERGEGGTSIFMNFEDGLIYIRKTPLGCEGDRGQLSLSPLHRRPDPILTFCFLPLKNCKSKNLTFYIWSCLMQSQTIGLSNSVLATLTVPLQSFIDKNHACHLQACSHGGVAGQGPHERPAPLHGRLRGSNIILHCITLHCKNKLNTVLLSCSFW